MITMDENGALVLDPASTDKLKEELLLSVSTPLGSNWQKPTFGSKLYLLRRGKATDDIPERAETYVRDALSWMTQGGKLDSVEVAASWASRERGALFIHIIARQGGSIIEIPYWVPVPGDPR